MARYALLDTTSSPYVVVNLMEWDGDLAKWSPPPNHIAVDLTGAPAFVSVGDSYNPATSTWADEVTREEIEATNLATIFNGLSDARLQVTTALAALDPVRTALQPLSGLSAIPTTGLSGLNLQIVNRVNVLLDACKQLAIGEDRLAEVEQAIATAANRLIRLARHDLSGTD